MRLFLSAGHTPSKPGACHKGFCEYDEAVRWVDEIVENLIVLGAEYFKVPTGTITQKANSINRRAEKDDVVVEIHFNSFADPYSYHKKVEGAETLYYPGSKRGKQVADLVQTAMVNAHADVQDRGVKEGWYRLDKERGIPIYILRKTIPTCLILEPEFIQHPAEIQAMRDDVCLAIASTLYGLPNSLNQCSTTSEEL